MYIVCSMRQERKGFSLSNAVSLQNSQSLHVLVTCSLHWRLCAELKAANRMEVKWLS